MDMEKIHELVEELKEHLLYFEVNHDEPFSRMDSAEKIAIYYLMNLNSILSNMETP